MPLYFATIFSLENTFNPIAPQKNRRYFYISPMCALIRAGKHSIVTPSYILSLNPFIFKLLKLCRSNPFTPAQRTTFIKLIIYSFVVLLYIFPTESNHI